MENEKLVPHPSEIKPTPVDISDRVRVLFEMPHDRNFMKAKSALYRELEANPPATLTLVLDYTTLDDAKTLKWLLQAEQGNKWRFAIRATEPQMKEAANVFASGVEWIQVEG